MSSRFQGRDFQTLRQEIVDFVRERTPDTWDSTNVADPMIRFIETVAMLGDHLHYYIDAMRRESDMATAALASSVYSYALREGYTLILPRSTHFRINLFSQEESVISGVKLDKFAPFNLQNSRDSYFLLTPLDTTDVYSQYPYTDPETGEVLNSPEVELVAGELKEVRFNFNDIDYYSRIELPESRIDPDMCELKVSDGTTTKELYRVEDVISDKGEAGIYSLTPSFVNGVERLYIEFPYNYRNLFPSNAIFTFRYITTSNQVKPSGYFESDDYTGLIGICKTAGGYRDWESPEEVKFNYKHYVRDFTSLVTKNDYKSFVNFQISSRCQVFDKADEYQGNFKNIPVRTIYILSDLEYLERERLRDEILKRSSRSDNIFMIPYGRKLYRVLVIVEANLMNESEDNIRSSISSALDGFYNDISEVRNPIESVIYHKIHSCNSSIERAWVVLISESYIENGYEFYNFPTIDLLTMSDFDRNVLLDVNGILKYFYNLLPDAQGGSGKDPDYLNRYSELQPAKETVVSQNILTDSIEALSHFRGNLNNPKSSYEYKYPNTLPYSNVNENLDLVAKGSSSYYDSADIDVYPVNSEEYAKTHFVLPSLLSTIIWVYSA